MKKLLPILLLTFSACNSFNKLVNGTNAEQDNTPKAINNLITVITAPQFNVNTPPGYNLTVTFGILPSDGVVSVTPSHTSLVRVFLMQRTIGQWYELNNQVSGAFWYQFDPVNGIVTYKGNNLELTEYCIYQYIKA